jgi:hypothetical protein
MDRERLDRFEMLVRKDEISKIIGVLYNKIIACDENWNVECDVCVGLKYAIATLEERRGE